jgi:hypothetical protein
VVDEIRTRKIPSISIAVQAIRYDELDSLWNIGSRPAREIVDSCHSPAKIPKPLRHVTTKEPSYACDENLQGISSGRD